MRILLAQGRLTVDGEPATAIHQLVDQFTRVTLDGCVLQAERPCYLMLNKPEGTVSATRDARHKTVIDLLSTSRDDLHIVGRLDFNSTGLMLLTNDGRWSRSLAAPENKVGKRYIVRVMHPIGVDCAQAFADGMYFPFEGITTRPAKLVALDDFTAEVTLVEGRYHQIKRMFGRFGNPVLSLHRISIGRIVLDTALPPGASRQLTAWEVGNFAEAGIGVIT